MTAHAPPHTASSQPPLLPQDSPREWETQVLTSAADIDPVKDEWIRFLSERAGQHTLMQHPDIVHHDFAANPDKYEPLVMIVRRRGHIEAVAPWFIHRVRFPLQLGVIKVMRVPLRLLKLAGAGMAFGRDAPTDEILDEIFSKIYSFRKQYDLMALFDVPVPGPLWSYLETIKHNRRKHRRFRHVPAEPKPHVNHRIVLPETFDAFMASLTSKKRNSLRRNERDLLEATSNSVSVTSVTSPDELPRFFQDVRRIYLASWQGRTMREERGTEKQVRFYQQVAAHGWYRAYLVRADSGPICYGLGYQYGDVYYCQDMAYDLAWRRCAPGNYMFINLIKDLYANNTPRVVDFGSGDNLFKSQFSNEIGSAHTMYIAPSRSYYGRAIVRIQRVMHMVHARVSSTLKRLGMDHWVRERVKRRRPRT